MPNASAQIANASYFPNMKSINPGVTHLRQQGFIAVNAGQEKVDRHQEVYTGGLKDGVQYDLKMNKKSLFRAGKGGGMTAEVLYDQAEGELVQSFEDLDGAVDYTTKAKSSYLGGIIDTSWFGLMLGKSSYDYHFFLETGAPPNYWAQDNNWEIDYNVMKLGTIFRFGQHISIGVFYLSQDSNGSVDFTFYDPSTGNKGSTENYTISTETKGYGIGLGYSTPILHVEISQEKITSQKLTKEVDFPLNVEEAPKASRVSFVAETKLKWFSLGMRYREISGNFYDLENIITAKLLYEDLKKTETRSETTFNFSFGKRKGLTYSAFYTTSDTKSQEAVNFIDNGELYPTITKSQAYGLNISYLY